MNAREGYGSKLINEYDIFGTKSKRLELITWGILFYFLACVSIVATRRSK